MATRQGNPKLAVALVRVSTDRQDNGPDVQRRDIAAWASREGVTVAAWHEEHVSGAADLEDRPALAAALASLRAHGAGLLVTQKRDRLARDPIIAALIERAVAADGAVVVSADGLGNGATPGDQLMRTMLDGFARFERQTIASRTKSALAAKRARGEVIGAVPWGWRAEGKALRADVHEQAVVAIVRSLRAEGMSLRGIVDELAWCGVTARTGKPLRLTQVMRLLA